MERLCFAEALTEEKRWDWEGIPVLTASLALPQLEGAGRFNRYYRRFCRTYLAYCRELLLPEAAGSCRAAMETSAPWSEARAEVCWQVSFQDGRLLSVLCDIQETVSGKAPFRLRRSEVWDLAMDLPVPLAEFFPGRWRKALLAFARQETLRRVKAGAVCPENWRSVLRRNLNPRNYYLTEEGLCFYYPSRCLGGAERFTLPYDGEKGPFPPALLSS